jgi:N-acetylglucosaminyldiphosphoundecaprenol N-acetyl-beta-D-mannosaminyltransferase
MDRVNILGVGVSAINMEMALSRIDGWIETREHSYIVAAPVHCIMECLRNEELRKIYNSARMVIPDGRPIAWVCRLMGKRAVEQVRGPDLMLSACSRFVYRGYRHFLYGGWPSHVVDQLASKLKERFPGIQIVGTYSPPFRSITPEEDAVIVKMINAAQPDIVWVGLGTTKEHLWTASHLGKISAPILIGVGAAFDFHSGRKPQAPRWMIHAGLEWFFRVLTEPRRLGPRYLRDNPVFVWNILRQALGKAPPPL